MAKLEYRKLSPEELAHELGALPGWEVEAGEIVRTFEFATYKDGIVFASAVGFLADRLDHHPEIKIGYQKVRVAVNTHAVKGLSPYDLELARRIESIF